MRHRHHASRRPAPPRHRRINACAAAAAAVAALGILLSPAAADDRDLLRFDSAKPYLFIVLDTSASMAMRMGSDEWAPGGADGPDSRLYQAKQALFNVLKDVDDVHIGFASYNQDGVRAVAKHWLYYNPDPLPSASEWPIQFPQPDLWDVDGDGSFLTQVVAIPPVDAEGDPIPNPPEQVPDTRVTEIGDGGSRGADLLTFGPPLETPAPDGSGRVIAGTCASPLDLGVAGQRDQLESLAIHPSSTNPTYAWVASGNRKYLLAVRRPGKRPDNSDNAVVGDFATRLHVRLELERVANGNGSCGTIDTFTKDSGFGTKTLRLDLRLDSHLNQFFYVNHPTWRAGEGTESTMPLWHGKDVLSSTEYREAPHSGFGWEGNYDSGVVADGQFYDDLADDPAAHNADFCIAAGNCLPTSSRVKPAVETVISPGGLGRALDRGDMLPFDWNLTQKNEFLRRLDPEYDGGLSTLGDFRIARHFSSAPSNGALPLVNGDVPLLAADLSPLARAITDVRCWYLGGDDNKCKEGNAPLEDRRFPEGWSSIACNHDSSFGCRRSYLIMIGDGEDNVAGQNANGSLGNLKNMANMLTWALNVGHPNGCNNNGTGGLHSIVRAGGGECVNVETQERLRQVLEALIGEIRTTARSFASAAVPSVQATVEQKIFLTSFLPFNDSSVWRGSVHSFVKPLPVGPSGVPLTEAKCDGTGDIAVPDPTQRCHLWDAGEILLEKQYPASGTDFLDLDATDQRRVFYARQTPGHGQWPLNMRLFDPAVVDSGDTPLEREVRFDLWRGLGVNFVPDETTDPLINAGASPKAEGAANDVLRWALGKKTGTARNTDVNPPTETIHTFLLGDVFHSTPVVIGTPSNTTYFAGDLYGNDEPCEVNDGTSAANPGYRCFFEKQRFRRKILLVGSNDGMLHAFDSGMFRRSGNDHWTGAELQDDDLNPFGSFDNGTGKELFAYVPRMVLPTLKSMRENNGHFYTVDGTVTVADVFVDPLHQSGSSFPEADDREWRTVVVGGLREGGRGYYGLDITQPDPVEEDEDLGFVPVTAASGSNHPVSGNPIPRCTSSLAEDTSRGGLITPSSLAGCGPVPFPAALWEFTDSHYDPASGRLYFADEEAPQVVVDGDVGVIDFELIGNGRPDLAQTWSTPNIGRIRLCKLGGSACDPTPDDEPDENGERDEDDDLVDVYVAVVGGGFDDLNKLHDWRPDQDGAVNARENWPANRAGNWLYMIDIETGEAIYKQELVGAVSSEPAAVDTDGDGYLDRIYVGTLAGALYRVDIVELADGTGDDFLPATVLQPVPHRHEAGSDPIFPHKRRLPPTVWRPVQLFDTNFDGATDSIRPRQIYHRPSVIFEAGSGSYVLAFGTGDRDDLWNVPIEDVRERFYVFADPFLSTADIPEPMDESSLVPIEPDVSSTTADNLLETSGGWVMRLAAKERVITDAFALSGVMVFSTFVPRIEDGDGNEQPVVGCSANSGGNNNNNTDTKTCAKQGVSNVFVVNTTNANGLLYEGEVTSRYKTAPTFVTNPFAEPGQTKRTSGQNEEGEYTADDLSPDMLKVMEALQGLFPPQCKFANYRIDIKTVAADTSLQFIAPVPVCLIERNWKEF